MASSSDILRAKCSVIFISRQVCSPASAPQKTTSIPGSCTPTSSRSATSGVPAQVALPIPPSKKGSPVLPEHSMVNATSWRSRAFNSQCQRRRLVHETADRQAPVALVQLGQIEVLDDEELVRRGQPGIRIQLRPIELLDDHL